MGFDVGAALGGVGLNLVNNAIQYYTQKNQQRQAQANTQKNMRLQQQLEDESYEKRMMKATSFLKANGLSPVLMTGAPSPGAAAVSHNEAMPQVSAPSGGAELVNSAMLNQSQVKLNEAAAKKAEAEAKSTEIKNEHAVHQDKALGAVTHQMLEEMYQSTDNPFMRGFLDTYMDATSDKFNLGDYEAFNKTWFEFSQRERDRELDFIQKEFDKRVLQLQFENGAAAVLADMPKAKRYEIYTAVHQMNANIARLNAETSLTEDQRDKLRAETSKLGQEVMSIFHSDPAAMYKAGDVSALLVGLGYDAVKAAAAGAGFGVGAAVTRGAGAAGVAAKSSVPSIGSKSLSMPSHSSGMPSSVFNRIKANAAKVANGDKVYEAQLIDGAVRRWKSQNK